MAEQSENIKFEYFLSLFPEVELPVTLGDEAHHIFSKRNDPLHPLVIKRFLSPLTEGKDDEYTEYVPCFRVPDTHQMHAVVFWRAGLLKYEFYMATFTKKGKLIDCKLIAEMKHEEDEIHRQVTTIEKDWIIYVVEGSASDAGDYDPTSSNAFTMELLATGEIIFVVNEDIV